jgi:hypothetical protein
MLAVLERRRFVTLVTLLVIMVGLLTVPSRATAAETAYLTIGT